MSQLVPATEQLYTVVIMKQRNLLVMFILTVVTLGIYQIIWTYWTKQELNANGGKVPRFLWLIAPFLLLFGVAVLQFVSNFVINDTPGSGETLKLIANMISVVSGVVLVLTFIPIYLIWYYRYCQAVDKVTHGDLPAGLNYVLLIALNMLGIGVAWPLIVQNSYNRLARSKVSPLLSPTA